MRRLLALPVLLALGGCITTGDGAPSVAGECRVFDAPRYAVRGATQYDQDWIDPTIEGGIGACKWHRPAARPPEMDAPHTVVSKVHLAKKRPSAIQRVKAKIWPTASAPVVATPEMPAPLPEPVAPPPAPRSAIDELLNPLDRQ